MVGGSCLVLDFDGTILDTEAAVFRSWAELWERHGVVLDRTRWQVVIGTDDLFDPWAELQRRVRRPLDPALEALRRSRRDELLSANAPRDGVLGWLDQADDLGVAVAIASSSPQPWVEGHLRRLGLAGRFAAVVCRDETVPAKPDPMSYRQACATLGASPRSSVAVEDSPHGIAASVAAGLFTVAVPHDLTVDLDLSAADVVVTTLASLSLARVLEEARGRAVSGGP